MIYRKRRNLRPPYWKNWQKRFKGEAISFVSKQVGLLKAIQRHTGLDIKVLKLEPVKADSISKSSCCFTNKDETAFEQKAKNTRMKFDKYFDKNRQIKSFQKNKKKPQLNQILLQTR